MDMMDEWGERAVGVDDIEIEQDMADLSLEQSIRTGFKVTVKLKHVKDIS